MKLIRELMEAKNESQSMADNYVDYAKDVKGGDIPGALFSIRDDGIRIYQETDEDEELDKYDVDKADVDPETYAKLVAIAKKQPW